jgi:hypothetical protein
MTHRFMGRAEWNIPSTERAFSRALHGKFCPSTIFSESCFQEMPLLETVKYSISCLKIPGESHGIHSSSRCKCFTATWLSLLAIESEIQKFLGCVPRSLQISWGSSWQDSESSKFSYRPDTGFSSAKCGRSLQRPVRHSKFNMRYCLGSK